MKFQFKTIRKRFLKVLISIVIIISLGVALLFGLMNGILSVHKSVDKFIEDNNYPDIKIVTKLEDAEKISEEMQKDYPGLRYRLNLSTIIKNTNGKIISANAFTYTDEDINDFYIWNERQNNTNDYDIIVEKRFATNNDIKLGNSIKLRIDGKWYDFYVSKIISIPEAIVSVPINGFWGEINDYGNVYINKNVLEAELNKVKDENLEKVKEKENELEKEIEARNVEYNQAKNQIYQAKIAYYAQRTYYIGLKKDLYKKKDELNSNKEKLLKLKSEYKTKIDQVNDIEKKVNYYIDAYDGLSDDAKKYIKKTIEDNYPDIGLEDVELVMDIGYFMLNNKVNEWFDSNTEINGKIRNVVSKADTVKQIIDSEYEYINSDTVTQLIEKIENNEDVTGLEEYDNLKNNLKLFGIAGEIDDDNVLSVYKAAKEVVDEIRKVSNRLPFENFSQLYDFLDNSRILLPDIYQSIKENTESDVNNVIKRIQEVKIEALNRVDSIGNSNKTFIQKCRLSVATGFGYLRDSIDEMVIASLEEYTSNRSGEPISIIDNLLGDIDNGMHEIDYNIKSIDNKLYYAYKQINANEIGLENGYNAFEELVLNAQTEINDKKNEIDEIKGYESKFNEILIKLDNSENKEATLNKIKNTYLKNVEIVDSYTYEHSPIYNYINYNIVGIEKLVILVPIVFYIIILIVLYLFISLIIKQSKKEIAIFRLHGISKNKIRLGFCINNLLVSLLGLILGFGIGILLMRYIVSYYKNFFLLPTAVYEVNAMSIILSIIVTIIVIELATIMASVELDKITPIEVLSKREYKDKEVSKFTNFITSKFNPLRKFSFIVFVRNKSRLILGIMCTSATVALIFSSLAYVASKDKIFNNYFDERINYDAQVFKKGNISDEYLNKIRSLKYVKKADLLRYFNVTIQNNGKEVDTVINALDNTNDYIRFYDKNNNLIKYPENGIVLEEHVANSLGLKKNDEVEINGVKFKIVDISFQSMGRVNYISLSDSYKLNSSFDTIIMKMDNSKKDKLLEEVSKDNDYIYTLFNDNLKEYNKKIFDSYTIPSIIIIIFSLIIGYIIIINLNTYNIIDQKRNLSIFKTQGFSYKEISKNWFIQSIIQCIISVIIGLPIGVILSKIMLKTVSSPRREFIYASGIKEVIITVVLLFIYIYVSHKKSMSKFKKIDIIEEVKGED